MPSVGDDERLLAALRHAKGEWVECTENDHASVRALRRRGYIIEQRVRYRLLDGPRPDKLQDDWPVEPPHYDERDVAGA